MLRVSWAVRAGEGALDRPGIVAVVCRRAEVLHQLEQQPGVDRRSGHVVQCVERRIHGLAEGRSADAGTRACARLRPRRPGSGGEAWEGRRQPAHWRALLPGQALGLLAEVARVQVPRDGRVGVPAALALQRLPPGPRRLPDQELDLAREAHQRHVGDGHRHGQSEGATARTRASARPNASRPVWGRPNVDSGFVRVQSAG